MKIKIITSIIIIGASAVAGTVRVPVYPLWYWPYDPANPASHQHNSPGGGNGYVRTPQSGAAPTASQLAAQKRLLDLQADFRPVNATTLVNIKTGERLTLEQYSAEMKLADEAAR